MDLYIWILIGGIILFMIYFILTALIKYYEIKKEFAEANTKVIYEKKFIKTDYDNDLKPLLTSIQEQCSNLSFTGLKEYYNSKSIVNDKVFSQLVKDVTINICKNLSNEYKDLLSSYVTDVELFIYEKVYYNVLIIVMDINKKNISSLN